MLPSVLPALPRLDALLPAALLPMRVLAVAPRSLGEDLLLLLWRQRQYVESQRQTRKRHLRRLRRKLSRLEKKWQRVQGALDTRGPAGRARAAAGAAAATLPPELEHECKVAAVAATAAAAAAACLPPAAPIATPPAALATAPAAEPACGRGSLTFCLPSAATNDQPHTHMLLLTGSLSYSRHANTAPSQLGQRAADRRRSMPGESALGRLRQARLASPRPAPLLLLAQDAGLRVASAAALARHSRQQQNSGGRALQALKARRSSQSWSDEAPVTGASEGK